MCWLSSAANISSMCTESSLEWRFFSNNGLGWCEQLLFNHKNPYLYWLEKGKKNSMNFQSPWWWRNRSGFENMKKKQFAPGADEKFTWSWSKGKSSRLLRKMNFEHIFLNARWFTITHWLRVCVWILLFLLKLFKACTVRRDMQRTIFISETKRTQQKNSL